MYPNLIYVGLVELVAGIIVLVFSLVRQTKKILYLYANVLLASGYLFAFLFYLDAQQRPGESGIPPMFAAIITFIVLNVLSFVFRMVSDIRRWDQWLLFGINALPVIILILSVIKWIVAPG